MNSEEETSKEKKISLSARLIFLIEKGWIIPIYRIVYTVLVGLIGVYISKQGYSSLSILVILLFIFVFGLIEFLLGKSIDSVKNTTREETLTSVRSEFDKYQAQQSELEFKLSLFSKITLFLSAQIQRTIRTLSILLSTAASGKMPHAEWGAKKKKIIENTLERMCSTFMSITSKKNNIPEIDVMFRSTYMVVESTDAATRLNYYAWHTPGGHQPRSASLSKHFKKGEGVAGIAWQRERVVIEDAFKNLNEWRDNYPGQGELYSSMACIPVFTCSTDGKDSVIGIITIDTNIKGFFGSKNDKIMEDKISNWVRPYADYIAFTTVMTEVLEDYSESE